MTLDNKTIVLTGGSSGIGLALLCQLGSRARIVNLSRQAPDPPLPASAIHIPTDLADAQNLAAAIDAIGHACPDGVDGLINCAAMQYTPRFTDADFDADSIAADIAVNLTAPIRLIAGVLPAMRKRSEAFVLNVNSSLAIVPKRESAGYCATKAGLDNFSRGLRAQLEGTGVRVFQAFLPLVDTPMTEGRGSGKLDAADVAARIIRGVERDIADHDIGQVALLRAVNRISPAFANRIMQKDAR